MPNYFEFAYVQLTHGYIYLFSNYFIAICVPIVLGDFSKKPDIKSVFKLIAEMLICLVAMELFAALYFTVFNSDTYVPFVCGLFVTVLYAVLISKKSYSIRIMRACTYIGLSGLALTVTMSMGMLLGTEYYYLQWLLILLNGIIIFSSASMIRSFSVKDDVPCGAAYVVVISVMGALCFAFAMLRRWLTPEPAASIVLTLIFIFIDILAYLGISYLVMKANRDTYKRTNEIMRNADREVFRLSQENLETLRKLRHEIKNHYTIMKSFVDSGDFTKLKEYFADYSEKIESAVEFPDCGNHTLNVIIGIERSRVRNAGAELKCNIAVPPQLKVNDVDLCSLVMNFVNNAAEYYERNETTVEKKVFLEALTINGALLVKVSNFIMAEHVEHALTLRTSKEDAKMHGYGSKIVAGITNKYNGSVSYEVKDGMFTACAMLFSE